MAMEKNTDSRKAELEKRRAELAAQKKAAEKRLRKRVILIVTAAVLLIAIALGAVLLIDGLNSKGTVLRNKTVIKSENFSINGCMMSYYVQTYYNSLKSTYGDDMKTYTGIDPDKSLRSQSVDGQTAYEAICEVVYKQVSSMVQMAEGAKAAGITISATSESGIRTKAGTVKNMPTGVTEEDITECMKLAFLADQYRTQLSNTAFSDDEIADYADREPVKSGATVVDAISYAFKYTEGDADSVARAKSYAEQLAACESTDELTEQLPAAIMAANNTTEEKAAEEAAGASATGVSYTDSLFGNWAFDTARADGDITVLEDTDGDMFCVYGLVRAPYLSEERTVSFQQILFTSSIYGTDARAKEKAEAVMETFLAGDKTAASFATLASDNNFNSVDNNGLYENTYADQVGSKLREWYFDASRKAGDCTVISGNNGYYLCYFIGEGQPRWYAAALSALRSNTVTETEETLAETYPLTENKALLASLPIGY